LGVKARRRFERNCPLIGGVGGHPKKTGGGGGEVFKDSLPGEESVV